MGKTNTKEDAWKATLRQSRQIGTKRAHAKVEDIRIQLRDLAITMGPGKRLPTIRELCTMLNTSSATLTEALDLLEIERVLDRKERKGIFVSSQINAKSIHIIFNVSFLTNVNASPFWGLLWSSISQLASYRTNTHHEHYTFHFIPQTPDAQLPGTDIALINSHKADGCLIIGFDLLRHAETEPTCSVLPIPHAVYAGDGYDMIQEDEHATAQLATEALVKQGCTNIGYWAPSNNTRTTFTHQQMKSVREILTKHHLPYRPELFIHRDNPFYQIDTALTLQKQGYELTQKIFGPSYRKKPDGIFICDDMITEGALVAFEEMGIRVGRDVQVATQTQADSPVLFGRTKHLITLEFNVADFAQAMFTRLDAAMKHFTTNKLVTSVQPELKFGSLMSIR